jgi:hypothetical protein
MTNQFNALPPLPEPGINTASHIHMRIVGYTADQMREYALQAIAAQPAQEPRVQIQSMAMLIKQLAYALRRRAPDHSLYKRAIEYLGKHGLIGSPLRDDDPRPAQPAQEPPQGSDLDRSALTASEAPGTEAIRDALSKLESQIARNPDLPASYRTILANAFAALADAPVSAQPVASDKEIRKRVTAALGLPVDGLRNGKPVGFAWDYLIGLIEDMTKHVDDAQPVAPVQEIYQEALAHAAFYVRDHCRDGEHHAEIIANMKMPMTAQAADPDPDAPIPASELSTCRRCGFRVKLNEPPQPGGPEGFGMRNAINGACTLCFGTGIDVAGEPCPFACNKGGAL